MVTHMNLGDYLKRIDYHGPTRPDLACLQAVHRAQALSIPYENIDVQLGLPLDQDLPRIFDKIVNRRRGGWCYEVNGLLHWALREIGFDVMRMSAGVHRRERGDVVMGNHMMLAVNLDQPYIADLGLGDGIREPIPLTAGTYAQDELEFRLEQLEDGHWRFHNHSFGYPPSFDFRHQAADEAQLAAMCTKLQSVPDSVFVLNLAAERMLPNSLITLKGKVLAAHSVQGKHETVLNTPEELREALQTHFGLVDIPVERLWPKVTARHEAVFGTLATQK